MSGAANQTLSRREIEEKIVALAWKDDAFRRSFVADPKGQFEKHLGVKLPAALKMSVHEEDGSHLYFVIPAKPKMNVDELSDADLEKVAGGVDAIITVIATAAISGAIIGTAGGTAVSVVRTVENEGWGKR
jgi:hypothetical protein